MCLVIETHNRWQMLQWALLSQANIQLTIDELSHRHTTPLNHTNQPTNGSLATLPVS